MPDLITSFERFKDELSRQRMEFQQHMAKTESTQKEINKSLGHLIDLQKETLREFKDTHTEQKIRSREEELESGRSEKNITEITENVKEQTKQSSSIMGSLGVLAASFASPKIIAGMISLALVDAFTKVNLRETIVAADVTRRAAGVAAAGGAAARGGRVTRAGAAIASPVTGAASAIKGKITGAGKGYALVDDAADATKAAKGGRMARMAGAVTGGAGAAARATGSGIMSILTRVGSILGPIVKTLGKIAWPLTILLSVVDGFIAAFKTYEEGGGFSEIITSFLMGALESFTVGFLDGLTTLVEWVSDFFADLPYYFGELIDGLLNFVTGIFQGDFLATLLAAFANLGGALIDLIWNLLTLIWEIPKTLVIRVWEWTKDAIATFIDWGLNKLGLMSDATFERKKKEREDAANKRQEEREKAHMEKVEKRQRERENRKRRNEETSDALLMTKEQRREKRRKANEERRRKSEDEAADAAEDSAESVKETADATAKTAEDLKNSTEDLSKMEDELIPESMKAKLGEFTKGIMGAMGQSVSTVGNLVQGRGIGEMLGGMSHASKRGAARTYGFSGSGSVFGRGGAGGGFGLGTANPYAPVPAVPDLPMFPGGMPPMLPGGVPSFLPTAGTDGQGRYLMDRSGSNAMSSNVIVPINNTTSNQVVHNQNSNTTLASGNIINEDRSIMMSMLQDNIHDSLI